MSKQIPTGSLTQVAGALAHFSGLLLAGVACFYWSTELQSWVAPYWPFDGRAKAVYAGLLVLALTGTAVRFDVGEIQRRKAVIFLRYFLAFTMMKYGCAKLFDLQFHPFLYWDDLLGRDFSAFDKAWVFFSHSRVYGVFLGLFECSAAALLFWRRTTLAGALMTFAILLNIVIVDIEYEIPIVWDAGVFLVISLYLIAPWTPSLLELFWTRQRDPLVSGRVRLIGSITAALLTSFILFNAYKSRYGDNWDSPLYGVWQLEYGINSVNQQLSAEQLGIRRLYFEKDGYFHVLRWNGKAPVIWASYLVKGNQVTTNSADFEFQGTYRKEHDTLILTGSENKHQLREVRLLYVRK